MNIQTGNGMGLKPKGMGLKPSQGMGIKTGKGIGLTTSKGMGLASQRNYFNFNEYERKKRYFFGDRGKAKQTKQLLPQQTNTLSQPQLAAHTTKSQVYHTKAEPPNPSQIGRQKREPPRQRVGDMKGPVVEETKVVPVVPEWRPIARRQKQARRVAVYCDCFFCQFDKLRDVRW